jgi:hypothetical protein
MAATKTATPKAKATTTSSGVKKHPGAPKGGFPRKNKARNAMAAMQAYCKSTLMCTALEKTRQTALCDAFARTVHMRLRPSTFRKDLLLTLIQSGSTAMSSRTSTSRTSRRSLERRYVALLLSCGTVGPDLPIHLVVLCQSCYDVESSAKTLLGSCLSQVVVPKSLKLTRSCSGRPHPRTPRFRPRFARHFNDFTESSRLIQGRPSLAYV